MKKELLEHLLTCPFRAIGAEHVIRLREAVLARCKPGRRSHLACPLLDVPLRLGRDGASKALKRGPLPSFPMLEAGEITDAKDGLGWDEGTAG